MAKQERTKGLSRKSWGALLFLFATPLDGRPVQNYKHLSAQKNEYYKKIEKKSRKKNKQSDYFSFTNGLISGVMAGAISRHFACALLSQIDDLVPQFNEFRQKFWTWAINPAAVVPLNVFTFCSIKEALSIMILPNDSGKPIWENAFKAVPISFANGMLIAAFPFVRIAALCWTIPSLAWKLFSPQTCPAFFTELSHVCAGAGAMLAYQMNQAIGAPNMGFLLALLDTWVTISAQTSFTKTADGFMQKTLKNDRNSIDNVRIVAGLIGMSLFVADNLDQTHRWFHAPWHTTVISASAAAGTVLIAPLSRVVAGLSKGVKKGPAKRPPGSFSQQQYDTFFQSMQKRPTNPDDASRKALAQSLLVPNEPG